MSLVITNAGASSIANNYGTLAITKYCLAYVADIQTNVGAAASISNMAPDGGNNKCDIIYNFSAYNSLNNPPAIYSILKDPSENTVNVLTCGTSAYTGSTPATVGNITASQITIPSLSSYIADTSTTEGQKLFDITSVSPVSTNDGSNVLEIEVDVSKSFNQSSGLGDVQYNRICLYNSMLNAAGAATGIYQLFAIMDATSTSPDGTTTVYNVLSTNNNVSSTYKIQIDLGSGALYQTSNIVYKNSILDDATQHYIQYLDFNACTADALLQLQLKCASISYTLSTLSSGTNNSVTSNTGSTSVTLTNLSTKYQSFNVDAIVSIPAPSTAGEFILLNAGASLTLTAGTSCMFGGSTVTDTVVMPSTKPITKLLSDGVYWFVS